jgi:hypothetical protein
MTKKFTNQHCVHCGIYFENLTKDHIFPESWYPESTPQGIEKWVVPACLECNNKLGKIEEECYKRLALSVSKDNIAASGVPEKAARIYNPFITKDENDKNRKKANIQKLIPNLIHPNKVPANAFMKNCGLNKNDFNKALAVYVPFELLNPFFEKVICGLEFKFKNKILDHKTRKIDTIYPQEGIDEIASAEIKKLNNILKFNGIKVDRGPGFIVRHAIDIYNTSLYHVTIWGKIELWGSVTNRT